MKIILILPLLFLSSCFDSKAQEDQKVRVSYNSTEYWCAGISLPREDSVDLYGCSNIAGERFDILRATNVKVRR